MLKRTFGAGVAALLALLHAGATHAVTITYADRASFLGALGSSITDDYSAPGYQHGDMFDNATLDAHSDAHMNAVFGETRYHSTEFANHNLTGSMGLTPEGYCAGCNGSFLLDFTATSIGTANGVFGVAFDFLNRQSQAAFSAFVTYGDGSTQNFALPTAYDDLLFFGFTADQLVRSIHFGLANGGVTSSGSFGIDNLTIGSTARTAVPEPATLVLFGFGVALLGVAMLLRRRSG